MNKLVSIVIRAKNEERWITQCLRGVFDQDYDNFEVIIVDNESSDKTLDKARQFKIQKILSCRDYFPGRALNMGIKEARGRYVVCLSGHCIPVHNSWLTKLLANFNDPQVAGVYGRQEALDFTSDADKRDLALIFGLDRKVQLKDSFFHNANSMIRKDVWRKIPFDESVTNIEDRVWAQEVLKQGYKIIYEPEASAYHYHGIHQNGDANRCINVVRILESLHSDYVYKSIDVNRLNIVGLVPVRGQVQYLNGTPLLSYTLRRAFDSKYISKTIVSTDNIQIADLAKDLGAEVPFIRGPALSKDSVNLAQVYQYSLAKIEELKIFPDLVICLEITFPFRPPGLIDAMILQLLRGGFDSVIAARTENKAIWQEREGNIEQLIEGLTPRKFKDPAFLELRGLACITHPEFIRRGEILGAKVGIYEVNNPYSQLEVRNEEDLKMASFLADNWFGK
ncbi:MAG: glycosyltransferase [Candidatus Omnitrophica bacterium]|nr:glycosyltransferase [Candidatus Omnitrophota bacterium]